MNLFILCFVLVEICVDASARCTLVMPHLQNNFKINLKALVYIIFMLNWVKLIYSVNTNSQYPTIYWLKLAIWKWHLLIIVSPHVASILCSWNLRNCYVKLSWFLRLRFKNIPFKRELLKKLLPSISIMTLQKMSSKRIVEKWWWTTHILGSRGFCVIFSPGCVICWN